MRSIRHMNPVLRATGVISIVAVLTTGVTFAVLGNQATLAHDSILSESAALRVNNDVTDTTFSVSEQGFAFTGIVPGTPSTDAKTFQLKNVSGSDVAVNAHIPVATLPTGVTGGDITFTFVPTSPGAPTVTATWTELTSTDGKQVLASLGSGVVQNMTVKVDIASTVGVSSVNIPDFDLAFGIVES